MTATHRESSKAPRVTWNAPGSLRGNPPGGRLGFLLVLLLLVGLGVVLFHLLLIDPAHHSSAHCPICYLLAQGFLVAEVLFIAFFALLNRAGYPASVSRLRRRRISPRGRAPPPLFR